MQLLTFVSASTVVIIRAGRIAEAAAIAEIVDPPAKKKRSDDNWRTARSVKSSLKREAVALEKCDNLQERVAKLEGSLDKAQLQAKVSVHELFLCKKNHRVEELKAEDLAEENQTKIASHHGEKHHLERRLTSLQQELETTQQDLAISIANRRLQGEMHRSSQRQQSRTHHRQIEEQDRTHHRQIEEKDRDLQEKEREVLHTKSTSFRDLRKKEKEVTHLKSQIAAVELQLNLRDADIDYKIAVATKDTKAKERDHFKELLDGKRSVIQSLRLKNSILEDRRIVSSICTFNSLIPFTNHHVFLFQNFSMPTTEPLWLSVIFVCLIRCPLMSCPLLYCPLLH